MSHQREIIRIGLQELSNATETGRRCRVSFAANNNEHWLRCTPTQINMDWPFASPPSENEILQVCFGSGRALCVDAWDMDSYVTFTPAVKDVDALISGIDSTFQDLYDLGADYVLSYKLEDSAPIEERLFEHVRGGSCPVEPLLSTGVLSKEWADTYLELLKEAQQQWQRQPCWPRKLVAAVHIVATELDVRYRAWCSLGRGPRNTTTEQLLNQLRISSELFLRAPTTEHTD